MLDPAFYYPVLKGKYEIKPGFFTLDTDFGNPEQDRKIFQLDSEFETYRTQKLASRLEQLDKYYLTDKLNDVVSTETMAFIITTLLEQQPKYFDLLQGSRNRSTLVCKLTGETLTLNDQYQLLDHNSSVLPAYRDTFDALACQLQDDFSIVQFDKSGHNRLSAIHLCFPNHWAAEDKIGKDFTSVHQPVPGIKKISGKSQALLQGIVNKGPYVRFAWGLATDKRLNHHPRPAAGVNAKDWHGRQFNKSDPQLYLRVERQVSRATKDSMLFTIRTGFVDCRQVKRNREQVLQLASAIESMSDASLSYKGIATEKDNIIAWLLE